MCLIQHVSALCSLQILTEIKGYANPVIDVKKSLLALLCLVDTPDLEEFLGANYDQPLPEEGSHAAVELWKIARRCLVTNMHHPRFILHLVREAARLDVVDKERTKVCHN